MGHWDHTHAIVLPYGGKKKLYYLYNPEDRVRARQALATSGDSSAPVYSFRTPEEVASCVGLETGETFYREVSPWEVCLTYTVFEHTENGLTPKTIGFESQELADSVASDMFLKALNDAISRHASLKGLSGEVPVPVFVVLRSVSIC